MEPYSDIFAENPKKPNITNVLFHKIDTGNSVKVKSRRIPYAWEPEVRIPYAWEPEVRKQVKEMIQNEIVEPMYSPWNSPVSSKKG